jgi:hypothetical protein
MRTQCEAEAEAETEKVLRKDATLRANNRLTILAARTRYRKRARAAHNPRSLRDD